MMKKFFIAALMVASSVAAQAQQPEGTFSVQPKVGLNLAYMTEAGDDSKMRVGFAAGAEGMYQITDILGVSAGLLYSQQGVKGELYDVKGTVKMDYLNIPVLANVYVAKGLAVKIGVQPGFLINNKFKAEVSDFSAEMGIKDAFKLGNLDVDTKTFDFTIPVGLSYEISNFVVDARYNWGLTKTIDGVGDGTKNSVFQLTVGYKLVY